MRESLEPETFAPARPTAGALAARVVLLAGAGAVLWRLASLAGDPWLAVAPGSFAGTGAAALAALALLAPHGVVRARALAAGALAFLVAVLVLSVLALAEAPVLDVRPALVAAGVLAAGALAGWWMLRRAQFRLWELAIAGVTHAALTGIGARLQYPDSASQIDQRPWLLLICLAAWAVAALAAQARPGPGPA